MVKASGRDSTLSLLSFSFRGIPVCENTFTEKCPRSKLEVLGSDAPTTIKLIHD